MKPHTHYEREVPSMSKAKRLKNGKMCRACIFESFPSPPPLFPYIKRRRYDVVCV